MHLLLGALAGIVLGVAEAWATTIDDLCPPGDPCMVTSSVVVEDGSLIDAGTRTLVVTAGKTIQTEVDSFGVTIRAAKIVLESGARIFGPASELTIRATGAPGVSGDIELGSGAALDVSNGAAYANDDNVGIAGILEVYAAGDFLGDGDLLAAGFGGGEDLYGTGGDIYVYVAGSGRFNHIDTSAGPNGYFGLVYLQVDGPVTVNGGVDMTGAAWSGSAEFNIRSHGDVVTNGTINLSVTLPEEAAGPVYIRGANVTINGDILARGAVDPYEGFGGYGGDLSVDATGNIDIVGDIVLPAAAGGGGGDVELNAGGHVVTGSMDLQGPGRYGSGGSVDIDAQGPVTLGSIDVSGGENGGSVEVHGAGPVTLGNVNAVATVSSADDPEGGFVDVVSADLVSVTGSIKARDVASFSGAVFIEGCNVTVDASGDIATVVARLTAHEQITISGDVHSGASNTFRYRAGGPVPIVAGTVVPAPVLTSAALTPCTAAGVCGNGTVEAPEECDHGAANGTSGDSCSATCFELPPALRIPGAGSRPIDCAAEWSTRLGQVVLDGAGLPRNSQICTDNDPACDADPTVGTCAFHVWLCVGAADPRIACAAATVSSVEVRGPTGTRGAPARVALIGALQALSFPVGPGEQCSGRAIIDVAGRKSVKLKTRAPLTTGKKDSDSFKLKCLTP